MKSPRLIYSTRERLKVCPLISGIRQMLTLTTSIQHSTGSSRQSNQTRKGKKKSIQIGEEDNQSVHTSQKDL